MHKDLTYFLYIANPTPNPTGPNNAPIQKLSPEIQYCWMVLDSFEHSSIQHRSNTIQHHLTMLDNVWPFERALTLQICLFELVIAY